MNFTQSIYIAQHLKETASVGLCPELFYLRVVCSLCNLVNESKTLKARKETFFADFYAVS